MLPKGFAAFLALLLLLTPVLLPLPGLAQEERIVRMGVFEYDGYYTQIDGGGYTGFAVDVMNMLAPYTGWTCEWVIGTRAQAEEWLKNGQVDLMCGVRRGVNRDERLCFSSHSIGSNSIYLIAPRGSKLADGELSQTLDGAMIGLLDNTYQENLWYAYAAELGVEAALRRYATENALNAALAIGEVDAVLSNIQTSDASLLTLDSFGKDLYYFAAAKENTALISELDAAIDEFVLNEPEALSRLQSAAVNAIASNVYTAGELEAINGSEPIKVALFDLGPGMCQYDAQTQTFSGAAISLLELIAQKSGLRFTYVLLPGDCAVGDAFARTGARIVAPVLESAVTPLPDGFLLTTTIAESRLISVCHSNNNLNTDGEITIARPVALWAADAELLSLFPNAVILSCQTGAEAMRAVADNRADMCLENELIAMMRLRSPYFGSLESYPGFHWSEQLRFAVHKDENPLFLSALNKAIQSVTERERSTVLLQSTAGQTYRYSLGESLYQNRVALLLLFGLIMGGVLGMCFHYRSITCEQQRASEAEFQRARAEAERRATESLALAEHRRNDTLRRQAHFSETAGIYNRAGFSEATRELLDEHSCETFLMIVSGIDHFQAYRDMFGKVEEERLVSMLALALQERLLGKTVSFGHLGADSFVYCTPEATTDPEVILHTIDESLAAYPKDYDYQVRIGIYVMNDPTLSINMMIDRAMIALRNAQSQQFKRYTYYSDEMGERQKLEQRMLTDMPSALKEHQFKLHYQPQYSLETGCITGVEALVRWEHPALGTLSPAQFIPLFEHSGLIFRLTDYVISEVLRQIRDWQEDIGRALSVAVNISRMDTFENGFVRRLAQKVDNADIPRCLVHLEITETAYIQNEAHMVRVVDTLRSMGFLVEMDDFGSGYSSLNTLRSLPVDTLKLDMRFLMDADTDKGSIILLSVVEMARRMRLPVIAEGVETREQVAFLCDIGCETIQGYYGCRPIPAGEMTALLKSGKRLAGYEDKP